MAAGPEPEPEAVAEAVAEAVMVAAEEAAESEVEVGAGPGTAAGEVVAVSGEAAVAVMRKAPATATIVVSSGRLKDVVATWIQLPSQPRAPTRLQPPSHSLVIAAAFAHCDDGSLCMQTQHPQQVVALHCCKQQLL